MKRFTVMKHFIGLLEHNDIIIIAGPGLVKDIVDVSDKRMYCFERAGLALSFSLGLAITTNKRVFVFCEDHEILRSFDSLSQIGVSGLHNIFLIVLGCGRYQETGGQPSIYNNINAPKASMFNLGMTTYDFSSYFKSVSSTKELKNIVDRARGPMAINVKIDRGITKNSNVLDTSKMVKDFKEFVRDLELGTSLFVP